MTIIVPTFPAHIAVSQAEVRLVADQTPMLAYQRSKQTNRASKPPSRLSRTKQNLRRSI
jgi:hypothetical protein